MPMLSKNPNTIDFDSSLERRLKLDSLKGSNLCQEIALDLAGGFSLKADQLTIRTAISFLYELECSSRESNYKSHAFRVAAYFKRLVYPLSARGVVLSVLHNVIEVAGIEPRKIQNIFGDWMEAACRTLTVDRFRQNNESEYNAQYYQTLWRADPEIQRVKIFDKLDNLLVLFLNPSKDVRTRYLDDIERWLVPMIRSQIPMLKDVVERLVFENRNKWDQLSAQYSQ